MKKLVCISLILCLLWTTVFAQNQTVNQVNSGSGTVTDSLAADSLVTEKPKYIKRTFDHKEQVIAGGVVMLCLVLIMSTINNYNPKR